MKTARFSALRSNALPLLINNFTWSNFGWICGVNETLLNVHEIIRVWVDSIRYCWYHHSMLLKLQYYFFFRLKIYWFKWRLMPQYTNRDFSIICAIGAPFKIEPACDPIELHSKFAEFHISWIQTSISQVG